MRDQGDELTERARSRIGQVVNGKWRLESLLGIGGMAAVYAATHRNGMRGAVKILHPEVALSSRVKARFLREGYVANKVGHPGAVAILDDDEATDGTVFLVMELLEGQTLDDKFEKKTMSYGDALSVAEQLLAVLQAAHEKNIVHRDLKPANIFLTRDGTIKILDFGIARLRELSSGQVPNATTMHSMGTPGFMAPEQARGLWEEVDARTDIWAVGATLFTLVTGKEVHEARTVNEQLLAGMTKPAPPVNSVSPLVPASLADVIDRALQFDREQRFQSAAAMQTAVRAAYQSLTGRRISAAPRLDASRITPSSAPPSESAPPHESAPTLLDKSRAMTTDGAAVPKARPSTPAPAAPRRRRAGAYVGAAAIAVIAIGCAAWLRSLRAPPVGPATITTTEQATPPPTPASTPPPPAGDTARTPPSGGDTAQPPPVATDVAGSTTIHAAATTDPAPTASGDRRTGIGRPRSPRVPASSSARAVASAASAPIASAVVPAPPPSSTAPPVDLFGRRR